MQYRLTLHPVEDVEEVRVLEWHKAEGEAVEADALLVEVETSKAIIELRCGRACVLRTIVAPAGSWVRVGGEFARFSDTPGEALDGESDELPTHVEVV